MKQFFYSVLFIAAATVTNAKESSQLFFVKNQNQWTSDVKFRADLPGGAVFLTNNGFTYNYYQQRDLQRIHDLKHSGRNIEHEPVHFHAYRVYFDGSSQAEFVQEEKQPFHHNYFLGNDPKKWAGNVPVYKVITYKELYAGIDAKVYSSSQSLKYDFLVAPNADPALIRMSFDGVKPTLSNNGDLQIKTSVTTIVEKAPYAYQMENGVAKRISCKYSLSKDGKLSFIFPKGYDRSKELVIDPVLVFATYSGSTANTYGFSATYDSAGCLYAGGEVFAVGWPATIGAFQTAYGGSIDAGLNKYSSDGSTLIYSTYYGGNGTDLPNNLIVTPKNQLVVTGSTSSSNLPVSAGCYDNTFNGGPDDIYVAKFSSNGSVLIGATYIGGQNNDGAVNSSLAINYGDQHRGDLLIDTSGNIIACSSTESPDFPVTTGAFQTTLRGSQDGVVFKLDSTCSNLLFSTLLGGSQEDECFSLSKANNQDIVVAGGTGSADFPATAGALHSTFQGSNSDGFVAVMSSDGTQVKFASFIGTSSDDHGYRVQVDPVTDHIFLCGQTQGNYPVSPGVYSNAGGNIFIQELSADLSTALLSTVIGGTGFSLVPTAFLYDNCGNIYFCGFQAGSTLPVTPNAFQTAWGGFWLCVLDAGMTNLLYASFMGGQGDHVDGGSSRFDPQGIVYHSVCTLAGFTTTPGSWQPVNQSPGFDVASFKFNFEAVGVTAAFGVHGNMDSFCAPATVQFTNNSQSATSYTWDFGDGGSQSSLASPTHVYSDTGTYTVTLYAHRPTACIPEDTAYYTVHVFHVDPPVINVKDTLVCVLDTVRFSADVSPTAAGRSYHWEPVSAITSSPDQQTIVADVRLSNVFTVTVTDSIGRICKETATGTINVVLKDAEEYKAYGDTSICRGDTAHLWTAGGDFFSWTPDYNITNINTPSVSVAPQQTTVYSVLISDVLGCKKERNVTVNIYPDAHVEAMEDFYIKYGESTVISAKGTEKYEWSPNYNIQFTTSQSPSVWPEVTTTYYVLGTSVDGCLAWDSLTVKVTNIILPSAFSPNGDGKNDRFWARPTHDGVRVMDFGVYNRWGECVFRSNQSDNGWDGNYKGKPADLGTYFYTITYAIGKKQYTEKGDVTLVR